MVLAFGQLFVCPQFVAEHNCGMRVAEGVVRVFVQVLGLISLSQCCWQPVCVHVRVSVCVCLCAGPRLIDATSFDFPSVSCDGGLDGRPRWVSHKVFMSSVCLSVPLLLRPHTPLSLSVCLCIAFALCQVCRGLL